ncbi:MAG: hypothetical protein AAGH79_07315 [Bacteroidota bacterium]
MEEIVMTFTPDNGGLNSTTLWATAGLVVALGVFVWGLLPGERGIPKALKPVISMLGFVGILVAGSTVFFSAWADRKIGPVQVSDTGIETPYGEALYANIRKVSVEKDNPTSIFPATSDADIASFLLIEEISGKTHVLSSENYPIQEILGVMRKQMETLEK